MCIKQSNGKRLLIITFVIPVIFLSSCSSQRKSKGGLAEDCSRLIFPYETFMTLYHDLRIDGKAAGKEDYEKIIRIRKDELSDAFTANELKKIYAFYNSPIGQRLLKIGLESKSNQPLYNHNENKLAVWSCSMHPEIRTPKEGFCPICGMKLVPVDLEHNQADDLK